MKKTFSADCLRKSHEKNFFSRLPEEITRKRPVRRPAKLAGYKKCLIRQAYLAGVPDALCRGRGTWAGYGMYPKCDGENFAGGRSPSFLLLIEEKKQKKIKAGAPAGEVCR